MLIHNCVAHSPVIVFRLQWAYVGNSLRPFHRCHGRLRGHNGSRVLLPCKQMLSRVADRRLKLLIRKLLCIVRTEDRSPQSHPGATEHIERFALSFAPRTKHFGLVKHSRNGAPAC